jgi:hypothetical protein
MSIGYLCRDCATELSLTGFDAVNEVGRKYCALCGCNEDCLIVVDKDVCDEAIRHVRLKQHHGINDVG